MLPTHKAGSQVALLAEVSKAGGGIGCNECWFALFATGCTSKAMASMASGFRSVCSLDIWHLFCLPIANGQHWASMTPCAEKANWPPQALIPPIVGFAAGSLQMSSTQILIWSCGFVGYHLPAANSDIATSAGQRYSMVQQLLLHTTIFSGALVVGEVTGFKWFKRALSVRRCSVDFSRLRRPPMC